jgi:hypothetical protein
MEEDLQREALDVPETYIEEAFWSTYNGLRQDAVSMAREKTLYYMLRRILFAAHHQGYIERPDYVYKEWDHVRASYPPKRAKRHASVLPIKNALARTYKRNGFTTAGVVLFLMIYSGRPAKDVAYFTWKSFTYWHGGYFKHVKYKMDKKHHLPTWFSLAFIEWGLAYNIDLDSPYIIQRPDGSGLPYKTAEPVRKLANKAIEECGLADRYTLKKITGYLAERKEHTYGRSKKSLQNLDMLWRNFLPLIHQIAARGRFIRRIKR